MDNGIKACFYDMDDTIVRTCAADVKAYEDVMRLAAELREQVDAKMLLKAWKERFLKSPWDPQHKVHVEDWRTALWRDALRAQDIDDGELAHKLQEKFRTARLEHFQLEPGVKEMVADLRQRGLKQVIITNGHPEIQRGKLRRVQAEELFDAVLVGGEEVQAGAAEKPAASIFLTACRLANCEPHEAVHIGDSLAADIQGGINAGLAATIWVSQQLHPPPEGPTPTHIVSHVTELPKVLQSMIMSVRHTP